MALRSIDHINIRTDDIRAMRDFFVAVLGLHEGRRTLTTPGYWLYEDGVTNAALIHISDVRDFEQTRASDELPLGTGSINHVAFRCSGYPDTVERLRELGYETHETTVPVIEDRQVFVHGPSNVNVELIFTADDFAGAREKLVAPSA